MHSEGYNTKQICPICSFQIMQLDALCIIPCHFQKIKLTKTYGKKSWPPLPKKFRVFPDLFSTPTRKMKPHLRVPSPAVTVLVTPMTVNFYFWTEQLDTREIIREEVEQIYYSVCAASLIVVCVYVIVCVILTCVEVALIRRDTLACSLYFTVFSRQSLNYNDYAEI